MFSKQLYVQPTADPYALFLQRRISVSMNVCFVEEDKCARSCRGSDHRILHSLKGHDLGYLYTESGKTLQGSFSAVSKPISKRIYFLEWWIFIDKEMGKKRLVGRKEGTPILPKKRSWGKQRRKWLQLLTSLCNLRSYTSPACKFPIFAAVLSFTLVAYQLFWEHLQYVSFVYPRGRKAVRALKRWPQWELIKRWPHRTPPMSGNAGPFRIGLYPRQCRVESLCYKRYNVHRRYRGIVLYQGS